MNWGRLIATASGLQVRDCLVLEQSDGTTCRARVEVRLIDGGRRVLFVKTAPRSLVSRGVVSLVGLGRAEIGFYHDAAPEAPLVAPRCYSVPDERGPFPVVLDDLVTGGAAMSELGEELSVAVVDRALAALARVHGTFWEDPRLASAAWSWCRSFVPAVEASVGWLLAPALSALGRRRTKQPLPDVVRSGLAHYAVRRTLTLRGLDRGPRTLLHHDCHPGNLAHLPDGRVVLFDWQLVRAGPWASDVAYLLSTSLSTDDRRAHERALVERYLDALLEAGGRPPAPPEAWRAYVAHLVYPLEAMVVTLALGAMQPAGAVERVVERTGAAVADHDAFAAAAAYR
jgi:Phosphotransferase enzyme family